ncbi:hypothetical protein [Arcobacter sp. FWKO B]|uniref:hypothetical protein n=1 Tax=Arcobacter sp. FWKO B TaxID=2593672 RepID=UPI0018A668F7|nr:hypothetical protein [Arcobacter sp. FWKO B]QOG13213.1 hypothetical protein FWKOB_11155 [Arcobacter sp. FWKO B]
MHHILKFILLLIISLIIAGCEKTIDTAKLPTHNQELYKQDRYCMDYLKFECLPESRDKKLLDLTTLYDYEVDILEPTPQELQKKAEILAKKKREEKPMQQYVFDESDADMLYIIGFKNYMLEMEQTMEKQYPGFWGDIPRKVRHRWMRLCIAKANKYDYGKRGGNLREAQQFIELCARIGLYFDSDPKWQYIVDFISLPESRVRGHAGEAVEYIDFTVYKKDYTRTGTKFTDWLLRTSLKHLPYPDRKVPRLND